MIEVLCPDEIAKTFSGDCTAQLNAWWNSLPAGTYARLREGRRYPVNGKPSLITRKDFVLDFNGASFNVMTDGRTMPDGSPATATWARTRCALYVDRCAATKIDWPRIIGANPNGGTTEAAQVGALEAQHGIWVNGGSNITIERGLVTDVYGDFLYIAGPQSAPPRIVRVSDFVGDRNGRQGISVCRGTDINITRFNIRNIARAAFDIEAAGEEWHVEDLNITNGIVGPKRLNFIAAWGRGTSNDVTFDRIACQSSWLTIDVGNNHEIMQNVRQHKNWTITNCTSDRSGYGTDRGSMGIMRRVDGAVVCYNNQVGTQAARMTAFMKFVDCTGWVQSHNTPNGVIVA